MSHLVTLKIPFNQHCAVQHSTYKTGVGCTSYLCATQRPFKAAILHKKNFQLRSPKLSTARPSPSSHMRMGVTGDKNALLDPTPAQSFTNKPVFFLVNLFGAIATLLPGLL